MVSSYKRKLLFIILVSIYCSHILCISALGEEPAIVGYGGVYTAGREKNYPIYLRNKLRFNKAVKNILERLSEENKLPFKLIFETDVENIKEYIGDSYTLAVVVTRDDVVYEKFSTPVAVIDKIMINIGMVVLLYQTGDDIKGNKRNTIVFSFPLVGYSINLEGEQGSIKQDDIESSDTFINKFMESNLDVKRRNFKKPLSDNEIDDIFIKNSVKVLEEHLAKRLQKVSLTKIEGEIVDINERDVKINIGATDGLVEQQRVMFYKDNQRVGMGTVVSLGKKDSIVKFLDWKLKPYVGLKVRATNIKGISTETYQVVNFKISSKKALTMFDEKTIGPQIAQWLSDFLTDKSGKVVLPSRLGGEWIDTATETSFMVLLKDGAEHYFEVPYPKYPLFVELTGVSSKVSEKNNVNEIWLYKSWIKIDIPSKNYSKEYSDVIAKNVVPGIQSFREKDEIFDLIYRLCAKISMEGDL